MAGADRAGRLDRLRKRCSRCSKVKTWREFNAREKWPDGTMRTPQGYCKPCQRLALAEWRRTNPEATRRLDRKAHARIMADPERRAILREQKRARQRLSRGSTAHLTAADASPRESVTLPSVPFAEWLRSLGATSHDIAEALAVDGSWLARYLGGKAPTVTIVDRYLQRAYDRGVSETRIGDLYDDGQLAKVAA